MNAGLGVAGIILAAGRSRRMGRAKAVLEFGGETFLGRLARLAGEAGLSPLRIVVGADAEVLRARHPELAPDLVLNEDLDLGQIHSLRLGLAALPGACTAVVVMPVDHPAVSRATIVALAQAHAERGDSIIVPRYRGRRGHPVLFPRRVFDELAYAPLEDGARSVVRSDAARVVEVEVDDPGVRQNIDTPEDYAELARHV